VVVQIFTTTKTNEAVSKIKFHVLQFKLNASIYQKITDKILTKLFGSDHQPCSASRRQTDATKTNKQQRKSVKIDICVKQKQQHHQQQLQ